MKNKQLRTKKNFTMNENEQMAVCGVEIYQGDNQRIEVILSKPDGMNYKGISTTNYFEEFATKIKRELLDHTENKNIHWFDRMEFGIPDTEVIEPQVIMDFDGSSYSNPSWIGVAAHA